jgi:hypothetical protein
LTTEESSRVEGSGILENGLLKSRDHARFEKDGFIFHRLRHCLNTYMRKAAQFALLWRIDGFTFRPKFG